MTILVLNYTNKKLYVKTSVLKNFETDMISKHHKRPRKTTKLSNLVRGRFKTKRGHIYNRYKNTTLWQQQLLPQLYPILFKKFFQWKGGLPLTLWVMLMIILSFTGTEKLTVPSVIPVKKLILELDFPIEFGQSLIYRKRRLKKMWYMQKHMLKTVNTFVQKQLSCYWYKSNWKGQPYYNWNSSLKQIIFFLEKNFYIERKQ